MVLTLPKMTSITISNQGGVVEQLFEVAD